MCLLTRNSIRRAHNNSARIFSAPVLFLFVCSREDANWRVSTSGTEMAQEEDVLYFPIDLLLFAPGVFTGSRNNISFRFSSILMFACLPVCVVVVCLLLDRLPPQKRKFCRAEMERSYLSVYHPKKVLSFSLEPNDDDDDETGRVCLFGKMRLTLTICWTSSRRWIDAISQGENNKNDQTFRFFFSFVINERKSQTTLCAAAAAAAAAHCQNESILQPTFCPSFSPFPNTNTAR